MKQPLPPVAAATSHWVDSPPQTLIARKRVMMKASFALGSLDC